MGSYLNPGNEAFAVALNSEIYVDKTGLLTYTNKVMNTLQGYICNSRPRRFGKSITANMLTAYYSKGCSSKEMFSGLEISRAKDFEKHLNQYDVIHLGYLAYDQDKERAFIPNEEIRQELTVAVESRSWNEMLMFQQESERLLDATLDMDGVMVGTQIEKIHNEYISVIQYHNENSLSSVLTIAYLSAMQYYFKPIRELPTGRGFADFVYIPKPEYKADYPALIVELKWNQNAQTAMQQIKNKKYPTAIEKYTGDILLVGISYDKNCKEHQCLIEKYEKES